MFKPKTAIHFVLRVNADDGRKFHCGFHDGMRRGFSEVHLRCFGLQQPLHLA